MQVFEAALLEVEPNDRDLFGVVTGDLFEPCWLRAKGRKEGDKAGARMAAMNPPTCDHGPGKEIENSGLRAGEIPTSRQIRLEGKAAGRQHYVQYVERKNMLSGHVTRLDCHSLQYAFNSLGNTRTSILFVRILVTKDRHPKHLLDRT